jgi:hypothetical protein
MWPSVPGISKKRRPAPPPLRRLPSVQLLRADVDAALAERMISWFVADGNSAGQLWPPSVLRRLDPGAELLLEDVGP